MGPRVSVVIPAFNNEEFIAAALGSALAQTYDDFEVVVADHSSPDGTPAVIETFRGDPRLRILEPTPAGGGAKANWNRVSAAARGELIKLLPGDDVIAPTMLERQVAGFDAHPNVVMAATRRVMVDARGDTLIAARGLPGLSGVVDGARAIRATVRAGTNLFGEPGAVLLRRDLLEAKGWWADPYPYLIDLEGYVGVLRHGDLFAIQDPLAAFRINAGQWSVRLVRSQAEQTIAFNDFVRRELPAVVSDADVRLGAWQARKNALARRLVYLALGRRLGRAAAVREAAR